MTQSGATRPPPLTRRFIAGYTLAQIGAFIGFVPLLSVLLPLKASALAPASAAVLLSQAAILGATAAGLSNFLAGWVSDHTRSRFGRRRPWILVGLVAVVASYGGVFAASTPPALIAALVAFQIAFNVMFAPLNAVFADKVPDAGKGLMSAFAGLAYPTANLFAALVVAIALIEPAARYGAVAAAVLLLVAPFGVWGAGDPPTRPDQAQAPPVRGPRNAFRDRDFLLAFGSRLLVQSAITINSLYLMFYLKELAVFAPFAGLRIEAMLGVLIVASTLVAVVSGFAAGVWSDRVGRRKAFVAFGGVAIAAGAAVLALDPAWPAPFVGQLIYGLGVGIFSTLDMALIAQVLPNRARTGRDLGVMNIAVTLPQVAAPLVGVTLLTGADWSLPSVFAASAAFAFVGGLLALFIRRVR